MNAGDSCEAPPDLELEPRRPQHPTMAHAVAAKWVERYAQVKPEEQGVVRSPKNGENPDSTVVEVFL
jgi:hypothetical protein